LYDFFKQMSETNHTVLILDDDHILAKMMADFLVISAHCTVDLTHKEVDFWTSYHAKQYDLIFMDYRLTEITGLEILEKLSEIGNKIPVVMMTGEGTEEIAVKAMQAGAFDYLVKGNYSFSILPSLLIKAIRMRKLQAEMDESSKRIHYQASLLNNMRDSIVVWDCSGVINFWNETASNLFGYPEEERVGKEVNENYFKLFLPPITFLEKEKEIERKYINKDGEIKWISSIISPLYDGKNAEVIGYMDVVRDISIKKAIENQLQQRLIMEKLLSSISNFFINIEPENTDMGVEKALLLIGNYLRPDYGAIYLVEDQNLLRYFCGFEKAVENSKKIQKDAGIIPIHDFPYLHQKLIGQEPLLINSLDEMPDEAFLEREFFKKLRIKSIILVPMIYNNELIGILTVFMTKVQQSWLRDHSHLMQTFADMVVNAIIQKRSAEDLRFSEARYRAIVEEHQTELICRTDSEFKLTFVNEKFCNYYHRTREELLGKDCADFIHPDDLPGVRSKLQNTSIEDPIASLEFRTLVDEAIHWLEWTVRAIFNNSGKLIDFQGIGRDITDRKEMEVKLKTAQTHLAQNTRMAAIGELASSIAHQISNPLTTIIAESQLLSQAIPQSTNEFESAKAIEKAGWRAQDVIQELLKFSEPGKNSFDWISINETIEKAILLTGEHIQASGTTKLNVSLFPNLPQIHGNVQKLEDLWVTLLMLARNATMDNQYHIITVKSRPWKETDGVCISVSDDGIPIQFDQIDNIFEPQLIPMGFGRGTGIELSLCREIVRQHQGQISVKMNHGVTNFEIYLPGELKK